MNPDKVVCYCLNITNGMIKEAVDAGASTLEEVQEATGAGTVCGACREDVRHLVEQFVRERNQCDDTFTFRQMTQNGFSDCKAAERGDAVASLSEANAADGNPGKSFVEM